MITVIGAEERRCSGTEAVLALRAIGWRALPVELVVDATRVGATYCGLLCERGRLVLGFLREPAAYEGTRLVGEVVLGKERGCLVVGRSVGMRIEWAVLLGMAIEGKLPMGANMGVDCVERARRRSEAEERVLKKAGRGGLVVPGRGRVQQVQAEPEKTRRVNASNPGESTTSMYDAKGNANGERRHATSSAMRCSEKEEKRFCESHRRITDNPLFRPLSNQPERS